MKDAEKGLVFLLAISVTFVPVVHAAEISAASCSQADVEAAIGAASAGDTVLVPAGTGTWNGLAIDKAVHLKGAGAGETTISVANGSITKQPNGVVRISGFSFTKSGGGNSSKGFQIGGVWQGTEPVIIHDNEFTISGTGLFRINVAGGVIFAGNSFSGGWDDSFIQFSGAVDTAGSWSTADTMGAKDTSGKLNCYIEDNTFHGGTNQGIDADYGGRVVCRNNTFTYSSFNTHGYATSVSGVRHFEIYGNTWVHNGGTDQLACQNWAIWIRGGTGVIFSNQIADIAGSYWGDKAEIKLTIRGAEDAPPPGATPPVSYPVPRQLGQNHDGTNYTTDPIHIWGNTGATAIAAGWNWGNPHALDFSDYFQWGRDGVNDGTAKPGYKPYTCPHPLIEAGGLPPLPQGFGLAADYPDDAGITDHPAVLFAENFEGFSGDTISWSEIGGWDNVYGNMVISRDAANVNSGSQAVEVACTGTSQQSHGVVKQVAGQQKLFVRYYMKFHAQFPGCHHAGLSIRGGSAGDLFANPTGTVPDGSNFFWVILDHLSPLHSWNPSGNTNSPGWVYNYCYHMDQDSGWGDVLLSTGPLNGSDKLGPDFVPRPNITPPLDRWVCYELMVHCNTPGSRDGRVGIWVDGNLVIDHPNLRFRSTEEIISRFVNLGVYSSEVRANQTVWYDDVVVATNYIGPMSRVDEYGIPDWWKVEHFGSKDATDGGALDDWDRDGMNNLGEYISGTVPTNALSVLCILGLELVPQGVRARFLGASGRLYSLQGKDDLTSADWSVLSSNVAGTGTETHVIDTDPSARRFYRLGVRME